MGGWGDERGCIRNNMGADMSTAGACCTARKGEDVREIPLVLQHFLQARAMGDADTSANCCAESITMRGPMGEFSGLAAVKERAFGRRSEPITRELSPLQYEPHLSTPIRAVYAREFEATIGGRAVPLRQEFTVADPTSPVARITLVSFSKLSTSTRPTPTNSFAKRP